MADYTNVDQRTVLFFLVSISRFHGVRTPFREHEPPCPGIFNDRFRNRSRAYPFNDPQNCGTSLVKT